VSLCTRMSLAACQKLMACSAVSLAMKST
jgi:hypothetical protein